MTMDNNTIHVLQRVQAEHSELAGRVERLRKFINSEAFYRLGTRHKMLLDSQLTHMEAYLEILNQRIHLFKLHTKQS